MPAIPVPMSAHVDGSGVVVKVVDQVPNTPSLADRVLRCLPERAPRTTRRLSHESEVPAGVAITAVRELVLAGRPPRSSFRAMFRPVFVRGHIFPRVVLGRRTLFWYEADVRDWLERQRVTTGP